MVRIRLGAVNQAAGGDRLVHSWQVEIPDLGPQPSKDAQGRLDGRRDIAVETIPKVRAWHAHAHPLQPGGQRDLVITDRHGRRGPVCGVRSGDGRQHESRVLNGPRQGPHGIK
jgi:hypothetical protein